MHKHPQLSVLYWWNVLKESEDRFILGVTFHSKMTFEKHLRSVFRAASLRVWYLEDVLTSIPRYASVKYSMIEAFGILSPRFGCCSASGCPAAHTQLKLQDRVVSGASFLTGGVFECDLARRRLWRCYVCCTRSGAT